MPAEATAVVGLSVSGVEKVVADVARWPEFLAGLVAVRRTGHERYVFTVRQGRREHDVLVAVRRDALGHRVTWRALEGAPWDGSLRLVALTPRRTRLVLRRQVHPRSFLAGLAEAVGAAGVDLDHDLLRLGDVLATKTAPAVAPTRPAPRPKRVVPAQRTAVSDDVLVAAPELA